MSLTMVAGVQRLDSLIDGHRVVDVLLVPELPFDGEFGAGVTDPCGAQSDGTGESAQMFGIPPGWSTAYGEALN
jgi:hypothetical protein